MRRLYLVAAALRVILGVSLALPLFLYQREKAPVLRRT
jgi:hypothetical protein